MQINKEIIEILKESNINKDAGLLVLIGIYYKLDVETVCPEEVIHAINLTKIVEKDYNTKTIKWNIPLFEDQLTNWEWVLEWNRQFNLRNKHRKDSDSDVLKRMQDFFVKYPHIRKDQVIQATKNYFSSVRDPAYLKSSAKFIFEGVGAMKKSMLLSWVEKLATSLPDNDSNMKGRIVS